MSKPVFEDVFRFSGRRNRKSYNLFCLAQFAGFGVVAAFFLITRGSEDQAVLGLVMLGCAIALAPLVGRPGRRRASDAATSAGPAGRRCSPSCRMSDWSFPRRSWSFPGSVGDNRYGSDPLTPFFQPPRADLQFARSRLPI